MPVSQPSRSRTSHVFPSYSLNTSSNVILLSSLSCPGDETNEEDTSFYAKRRSQLNVIFAVLGTPEESDLQHLDIKSARDIRAIPALTPCNLRDKYPGTDKDGLDLLRGLLKFDPAQRLNIDGALAHPFLASVRSEARELEATAPMRDDIETVGEVGAADDMHSFVLWMQLL